MDETNVECPYCGEVFVALIDWSEEATSYIQDCEVCCQPIRFHLHSDAGDGTRELTVSPEQE